MNLRDLGGYPVSGGGCTAWERLLRGDQPHGLTPEDLAWLRAREINTVVDLRSALEQKYRPDPLARAEGFAYFACPLVGGDVLPNTEDDVARGYFNVLDAGESVRRALGLIAQAPGGVLFHCTAGKDRTGLLSALLLSVAGVGRPDILADYQVSETYLEQVPMAEGLARKLGLPLAELAAFVGRSKPAYLNGCLKLLEEKYGTVAEYLSAVGLTQEQTARLRARMLE